MSKQETKEIWLGNRRLEKLKNKVTKQPMIPGSAADINKVAARTYIPRCANKKLKNSGAAAAR
jgi:hypothetical protein